MPNKIYLNQPTFLEHLRIKSKSCEEKRTFVFPNQIQIRKYILELIKLLLPEIIVVGIGALVALVSH